MFTRQCFTYIFCICWENESALDSFFVTLQQFGILETSSLKSCIFPVGISFRNSSWINIVVGDAISVVSPFTYISKCAITRLVVMDSQMCKKPIFLERTFRYVFVIFFFVILDSQGGNFFFVWWGTSLSSGTLSNYCLFETVEIVAGDGEAKEIVDVAAENGEAMEIADVVADDRFFLLNFSATFWECLEARFKSFLLIVYTCDVYTTTVMVIAKWFIWSYSSNVWRVRRQLKKKERKKLQQSRYGIPRMNDSSVHLR